MDGDDAAGHVLLQDRGDFGASSELFGKGLPEGLKLPSEKYAWDEDVDPWDEDLDVEALKKELTEQVCFASCHILSVVILCVFSFCSFPNMACLFNIVLAYRSMP